MNDTKRCPYCRQWIAMPLRRQREAFNAHRAACAMREGYGARDTHAEPRECIVPAWNPDCGLCGANIAADPFHHCAPTCECGRGPILEGNGTPDCCAECYAQVTIQSRDTHESPTSDPGADQRIAREACEHLQDTADRIVAAMHAESVGEPAADLTVAERGDRALAAQINGATVKRFDLWGNVLDSFRTESDLNGFKVTQGRMI